MSKLKKSLKIFYYFILACLVVVALLLVVSVFPVTGNYKIKIVESGSMEPAIKAGSVVVIKPVEEYKTGDIVTFQDSNKLKEPITHRIVDIEIIEGEKRFITQGDANNAPDQQSIAQDKIIGKVLLDLPYLGYAVQAAQDPIGFMLIIVIPGVIIIYDEFRKIWRETKKIRENKKKDKQQDKKIEHLEDEIEEIKEDNKNNNE